MNSNFSTLPQQWQALAQTALEAEQEVFRAPMYSAMLCRKSLEEWIRWIYQHDDALELPYDTSLNNLLHQQDFKDLVAPTFFTQLNTIRKIGNNAVHSSKKINVIEVLHILKLLHGFVFWTANMYSEENIPIPSFNEIFIPKGNSEEKSKEELKKLENAYLESREKLKKLEEELEKIREIKEENLKTVPPPIDPDESLTRKIYINSLLREAGWDPFGFNVEEFPVKGMPSETGYDGLGKVDYVLWGDDGKPLAVIEAKRTTRNAQVGQHQAKLYANCLEMAYGQRPVIFFTNGFESFIWDDWFYPPRVVWGFYTKDELQTLINRRTLKQELKNQTIPLSIADRYYQQEAIRAVTEEFEKSRRDALLVMATGTGKTRTAAALIDLLSKAGWIKRVLFLADRNALIHQAKVNLNDYLPHLPAIDLTKEKEDESSRIVFSTYQTMINQIDGEFNGDSRYYGVGHFDLVIFDEIHRSVYNRYKHIFKYFDGLRVGLTATPKTETDKDTYDLFELEQGNPTYAYELEKAIADGFLVPPKAKSVPLKFHRQGIKYVELNEEDKKKYEEHFTDPLTGSFPEEIDSEELNKWLFNKNTVDKVIGFLMEHGVKVEGGDKLGKTIVFARNHKHAKFFEERFNKQYPEYRGDFLKVIDYKEEYKYDLLNKFKTKEKFPQIAVSVDMLDTGIDVPEVVNLVFYKPVFSSSKFWQMIGRGTRLCNNLFAEGQDKTHFVIFDFCENFEFFGANPQGLIGGTSKSLSQRLFEIRLRLAKVLSVSEDTAQCNYSKELFRILIKQTQNLNGESFIVRQHWFYVEKYRNENSWNFLNNLEIKELNEHIAPIVVETDQDEMAKRFDAMMYNLQLFVYEGDRKQLRIVNKVVELSGKLSKKGSIPTVAQKMDILKAIQKQEFWQKVSVIGLEKVREDIRDIIKFLEKESRQVVYTNFEDSFEANLKDIDIVFNNNDLDSYKRKVEQFLRENQTNLIINKLRTNIPVTKPEINELEVLLFKQGDIGTKEIFIKAYGEQPLGKFVRSILGLDSNSAKTAFSQILQDQTLNAPQIRFLNTIIDYLTVKGIVEPSRLFESPFTDINDGGLSGVFLDDRAGKIINIIEDINKNAAVG
jgi:type I restriction enzyme, R subunit